MEKTEQKLLVSVNRMDREKKLFRNPERSDVSEALLKWFKQHRSDNVPVSGTLQMITLALPNCKLRYFSHKPLWKFTIIEE